MWVWVWGGRNHQQKGDPNRPGKKGRKTLKTLEKKNTLREDRQKSRRTKKERKILPNIKILGNKFKEKEPRQKGTPSSLTTPH